MALQSERIHFALRTGVGTQTIPLVRYPTMVPLGIIFLCVDNSGTNSEIWSFGVDDGVTHIGTGMGLTETFGVSLTARGYSTQYSMVTEQAQAFFGGAQMRFRGYVSATAAGSFTITTDLNNTPGAQWEAIVIGGDGVRCKVGQVNVFGGGTSLLPAAATLGFTPAAFVKLSAVDVATTGEVAGAYHTYGFAVPCGVHQASWGIAAGALDNHAKRYQINQTLDVNFIPTTPAGTTPTVTKFVSTWQAHGFTVDGTATSGDYNIGYLAIGGSAVSANLVSANQPTGVGVQNIAIDADTPVLALFGSDNAPTASTIQDNARLTFGMYDGAQQLVHWWGMEDSAPFPFKRDNRSSGSTALLFATATGASSSTINAQAACTGLTAQNVALNWTTVDATAREFWVLVLAQNPDATPNPCGAGALSITCPPDSTATVGVAYSSSFGASSGTLPYTFTLIAGAFPPGLTLDASTGLLSGTPTAAGTFTFTVQVTDAAATEAHVACQIVVAPEPPPPTVCVFDPPTIPSTVTVPQPPPTPLGDLPEGVIVE